nr:nuclear transport factor 2 family protein [Streptomyces coryli]
MELAALLDRLAVDDLVSAYAAAVDSGDWEAYQRLFAPGGRADYRGAGGIAGPAAEAATWLSEVMGIFPVRQHLIVNRVTRLEGEPPETAMVRADYINPMLSKRNGATAPDFVAGGTYAFTAVRSGDGWALQEVVIREIWRWA